MRAMVLACIAMVLACLLMAISCLSTAHAAPHHGKIAKRKAAQLLAAKLSGTPQLKFHLTHVDKAAVHADTKAKGLRVVADEHRVSQAVTDDRIQKLQELIDADTADEVQLRTELVARLVAQYQQGSDSAFALIATAGSLGDALNRADTIHRLSDEDQSLAQQHVVAVARLQEAQYALQLVRDNQGELATSVDAHTDDLATQLVSARETHESELLDVDPSGKRATAGTYRIFGGVQTAAALMFPLGGQIGGSYGGGTRTPARPATDLEINTVLSDPRITVYAGGRIDIATRQIDGRILDALELLAGRFGTVNVTMLRNGHSVMTTSGNVSEHSFGCAVDIGSLSGIRIQPSTQGPGSITEKGVEFLISPALSGDLAPHQVISLFSYGGASLGLADHYDHIHLGYHC